MPAPGRTIVANFYFHSHQRRRDGGSGGAADRWSVSNAAIRSCAAARGRGSRQQIQEKRPLRRIEVLKEVVDIGHVGEGGADHLDLAEGGLRFGFPCSMTRLTMRASASMSSAFATSKGSATAEASVTGVIGGAATATTIVGPVSAL